MKRLGSNLCRNTDGAVAPTVALSLVGLIAIAGVGFDYARLVNMDTEIQDAADHAALAAATQLDGEANAQARATQAAQSLITNNTRFATGAFPLGIASVTFYSAYTSPTVKTAATGDADSNFVEVQMNPRTAKICFDANRQGLFRNHKCERSCGHKQRICGVVPFFVCNPGEPAGNADPVYLPAELTLARALSWPREARNGGRAISAFLISSGMARMASPKLWPPTLCSSDCSPTDSVTTETGKYPECGAGSLNMRFDFKPGNASACKNPPCSPSTNVIKDVVKQAGNCSWQAPDATAGAIGDRDAAEILSAKHDFAVGKDPVHYGASARSVPLFPGFLRQLSALRVRSHRQRNVGSGRLF